MSVIKELGKSEEQHQIGSVIVEVLSVEQVKHHLL